MFVFYLFLFPHRTVISNNRSLTNLIFASLTYPLSPASLTRLICHAGHLPLRSAAPSITNSNSALSINSLPVTFNISRSMAPPGRRRSFSVEALLPLLILLLLSSAASAASAVLGVDLGTEYIKAALVKPGIPLEIVLTKDSKRKEAATIAFKPSRLQATDVKALPERLYGADATAVAGRYPGDVYPNLKPLLGVHVDSSVMHEFGDRYPALKIEPVVRNETSRDATAGFHSQAFDKDELPFMVEELLAMELKNIKANAERPRERELKLSMWF